MIGFTPSEIRSQSLLDFMVTKLNYSIQDLNEDALIVMNKITLAPGIMKNVPDNIVVEDPLPCPTYQPCMLDAAN